MSHDDRTHLYLGTYRVDSNRLRGWDYASAGSYFVTICTKDHRLWLGAVSNGQVQLSPAGEIVSEEWQRTAVARPNVALDAWVVMPNHLHGVLFIANDMPRAPVLPSRLTAESLGALIGQFKGVCTRRIRALGIADFAWQRGYYDHIVRNVRDLERIRAYVYNNPAQWESDRENPAYRHP